MNKCRLSVPIFVLCGLFSPVFLFGEEGGGLKFAAPPLGYPEYSNEKTEKHNRLTLSYSNGTRKRFSVDLKRIRRCMGIGRRYGFYGRRSFFSAAAGMADPELSKNVRLGLSADSLYQPGYGIPIFQSGN